LTQWLVARGGWTLDGLQTVFNYIAGTAKSDARVGRALSGWKHTDSGGACPSVSDLPPSKQVIFKYYTARLMGHAVNLLQEVQLYLMSSLVLYWTDFIERYPSHLLANMMLSIAGVTEDKLRGWQGLLRKVMITCMHFYAHFHAYSERV
jgi:hypothetical protein